MSQHPSPPSSLTGWRRLWFLPTFVVFVLVTEVVEGAAPDLLDAWYVRVPVVVVLAVVLMGLGRRAAERLEPTPDR